MLLTVWALVQCVSDLQSINKSENINLPLHKQLKLQEWVESSKLSEIKKKKQL